MIRPLKISVIVPVYNEEKTITQVVKKVQGLPFEKEIIIVDDGSSDGTAKELEKLKSDGILICPHKKNKGKGAAIKTGFKKATGEIIALQDADLEYFPGVLPTLIQPILSGKADVVYGTRFVNVNHIKTILYYGNRLLTYITSLLFLTRITDMETGYKVFKKSVLDGIKIRSNRFDFEPEITAKILKKGVRFLEIPIPYKARTYKEGKKLTWRDGIVAFFALLRYRFFD